MAEILGVSRRYKTEKEMNDDLVHYEFDEIHREDLEPTIRRACERGIRSAIRKTKDGLVEESKNGIDSLKDRVVFGTMKICRDTREYVGVYKEGLRIDVVSKHWVEKRRSRYEKSPFPENKKEQQRVVEDLIFEIVERWSGGRACSMGVCETDIKWHVADFANIELAQAGSLVDEVIQTMKAIEKTDRGNWRVTAKALAILSSV